MASLGTDTENGDEANKIENTLGITEQDMAKLRELDRSKDLSGISDSDSSSFGDEFDSDGQAELDHKIDRYLEEFGKRYDSSQEQRLSSRNENNFEVTPPR